VVNTILVLGIAAHCGPHAYRYRKGQDAPFVPLDHAAASCLMRLLVNNPTNYSKLQT
jgi:hypothetical protein